MGLRNPQLMSNSVIPGGYQPQEQQVAELPPIAPLNQNVAPLEDTSTYNMPSMAPYQTQDVVTTTPTFDPGYKKAEKEAIAAEKDLYSSRVELEKQKMGVEALKADAEAQAANAQAQESARIAKEEMDIATINSKDYNDRVKEIDKNLNELKEYKFHNYFENKGTGSRILAAFAIGLGSFSGNKNNALAIINKAIDDDTQMQIQQYNAKKASVESMREALNTSTKLGLDQQAQRSYINSLKSVNVADQLKDKLAQIKVNNPTLAAETAVNLDQFKADNLKNIMEIEAKSRGSRQVSTQTVQPKLSDVAGPAADLRKELLNRKETVDYQAKTSGYQTVMSAKPDRVGDLSLIYGYVKTLDPGSMVKEQEVAMQTEGRSPNEKVQGLWQKVQGGGTLTDNERKQMREQATIGINKYYKDTVEPMIKDYMKVARSTGVDPEMVRDTLRPSHLAPQQPSQDVRQQISDAKNWIKANPNDPRVPQAMKKLYELQGVQNASK